GQTRSTRWPWLGQPGVKPTCPSPVWPNPPTRRLRLLVDHRDDLVAERTRVQCRLRWHLHELDPTLEVRPKGLRCRRVVGQVAEHLAEIDGPVAEIARELLTRCAQLNQRVNELEGQIKQVVE